MSQPLSLKHMANEVVLMKALHDDDDDAHFCANNLGVFTVCDPAQLMQL